MFRHKFIMAVTVCAGLAACGGSFGEQAVVGAGAGAAGGAVLGGDVKGAATGALVGAAANVAYCQQFPGRCN